MASYNANNAYDPMLPVQDNTDTLGTGLKTRARERRQQWDNADAEQYTQMQQQTAGMGMYGPMRMPSGKRMTTVEPDPMWEGLFQAMGERGVDEVGYESSAGKNLIGIKPMQGGYSQHEFGPTPFTGFRPSRPPAAAMHGLRQAGPEGPDLKQKRADSEAADRGARKATKVIDPNLYGRGQ